jgi:hypothetical protein
VEIVNYSSEYTYFSLGLQSGPTELNEQPPTGQFEVHLRW